MASENSEKNSVWHFRYYLRRVAGLITTIPYWKIERRVLGRVLYERINFYQRNSYWPHLRAPRSFSEKTAHRKLFETNRQHSIVADKWAVRGFVKQCGCEDILNDVYCVVESAENIPWEDLPNSFVLKANHGSGTNLFVIDKSTADEAETKSRCADFLRRDFGGLTNEPHYALIRRKIIAEQFLRDADGKIPADYKFFVFHGRVEFVQVVNDRFEDATTVFYDRDWKPQPFSVYLPIGVPEPRPVMLSEMIAKAEVMGSAFAFVRIDLYLIDGKRIVFGEMTLTSWAAWEPFVPREWDFRLGALW